MVINLNQAHQSVVFLFYLLGLGGQLAMSKSHLQALDKQNAWKNAPGTSLDYGQVNGFDQ